jgi:hypothetical protein
MTLNVVREKILIDAGPSAEGWSSLESFARCERLYYWTRVYPRVLEERNPEAAEAAAAPTSDPLVRGSIGHVGLAHEYARRAAVKAGLDPDIYYTRDEAMKIRAAREPHNGQEMLEVVAPVVDAYFENYDRTGENLDVVAIESQVRAVLEDGNGITQRLDLVIRDIDGRYWIYDHKFVHAIDAKTVDRYTLSGQFLLMRHFGRAFYGAAFGGVRVNLCGVRDKTFKRASPEPAPAALSAFPSFVVELRRRIAAKKGLSKEAYLPSFNEQTCVTAYGRCSKFEECQWG